MQIMGVEDRAHVAQTVAGDGGDLRFAASDQRQSRDRGAAQIVERQVDDAGFLAGIAPRGAEAA